MNPHYRRGEVLFDLGRYAEAEREYTLALSGDPSDEAVHRARAFCLRNLGRDRAGCEAANTALSLEPGDWKNYYALAMCLVHLSYEAEGEQFAEKALNEALRLAPDESETWSMLALLRWRHNRPGEMIVAAREGLRRDPLHLSCRIYEAEALLDLGDMDGAELKAAEILRLHPDSSRAHSMLGRVRLRKRDPKAAEVCFREALRIAPVAPLAQSGLKDSRSWIRRQLQEESDGLALFRPDDDETRPRSGQNIALLIQELRAHGNPRWQHLLLPALRLWLWLPWWLRPRARSDLISFVRLNLVVLVYIVGSSAMAALFLLAWLNPGTKGRTLSAVLGCLFCYAVLVTWMNVLLRLRRWMERRVAEAKWRQPVHRLG